MSLAQLKTENYKTANFPKLAYKKEKLFHQLITKKETYIRDNLMPKDTDKYKLTINIIDIRNQIETINELLNALHRNKEYITRLSSTYMEFFECKRR